MKPIQHVPDIPTVSTDQNIRTERSFYNGSGSTISAGDVVSESTVATYGLGSAIQKSTAAVGGAGVIGAALADIPTGAWGPVCCGGVQALVKTTSVTAGDLLVADNSNAGKLKACPAQANAATQITNFVVARALSDTASGTSTVRWLYNLAGGH